MRTKRWRAAIPEAIAWRGVERGRLGLSARRAAERSMRFGRGKQRALLASVGGVAVALAASLASAEAAPADRDARLPLLPPQAAPSLGEVGAASPLVAVFNAARAPGAGAPSLTLFASPKLDFTPVGEIAPLDGAVRPKRPQGQANETAGPAAEENGKAPFAPAPLGALSEGPSAQDNPPPGFAAAPIAAPLSPMQSALETALDGLVARANQPNPLGAGDWRAARAAIAAFYAARDYAPVWVSEDGLTVAGRAALSQLELAGDDGLDLSQFALPRGIGPGLAADAL